jgi:endonuclease-8
MGPAAIGTAPAGRVRSVAGQTVAAVYARGKNLLIRLCDGKVILTHLGMTGSWYIYRLDEPWEQRLPRSRVALVTEERAALCFDAPAVALVREAELAALPTRRDLGPDLLAEDFDCATAVARLQTRSDVPIGVALLDQRLVAGIGNVYKSEVLFMCGVDPFTTVAELDDASLEALLAAARRAMWANRDGFPRRTRPRSRDRYWVYGRSGRPCARCGELIRMRRQCDLGRSTYYCPTCQR